MKGKNHTFQAGHTFHYTGQIDAAKESVGIVLYRKHITKIKSINTKVSYII